MLLSLTNAAVLIVLPDAAGGTVTLLGLGVPELVGRALAALADGVPNFSVLAGTLILHDVP